MSARQGLLLLSGFLGVVGTLVFYLFLLFAVLLGEFVAGPDRVGMIGHALRGLTGGAA